MSESWNPAPPARRIEIRQIFYSEETQRQVDPAYIPLDNTGQRPDWREYWPIRTFLLAHAHALDEEAFYGFFSPKFAQKTKLDSSTVLSFIASAPADVDIVAFSPFFDQGAVHLNVFEQAATNHAGIWPIFEQAAAIIGAGVDLHTMPMDSRSSLFCNYFVAKPAFWRRWLEKCEVLFAVAEAGGSEFAERMNAPIAYGAGPLPAKVFVMERMIGMLVATERRWRVHRFDPLRLPMSGSIVSPFPADLLVLDALKTAAIEMRDEYYLQMFRQVRDQLMKAARSAQPATSA